MIPFSELSEPMNQEQNRSTHMNCVALYVIINKIHDFVSSYINKMVYMPIST